MMKPHEVSLGLSLAYFHEFVAAHGGRTAFEDLSTANVCTRFVMPTTELSKLSLVDHVLAQPGGDKFAKPAQWLISHSWSYKFLDVVDAIDNFCHEHALDMDTSFWFCMFANNQHAIGEPTVMFDVFLHAFRTALADTGKMVMVLSPWHDPATLKRTWCVYEVYLSIVLNARFEVAMGKTQQAAFLDDIHELESINRMRAQVNCKHSSTTVPSDRDHIFKLIDDTVGGTDKLDRLVFEVMQTWVLQTVGNQVKVATTPEDRFRWLFTQAQTLVVVGRCTEALEVYQSAMDLFAANLPLTFWRGWQALYRFAELKAYTGQPRELWEPMFDEAVPRLQTLLGKDHNVALSALREAGFWLCRSGCTDRYRKMLTDCLALETRKADDNDDMIKTLHYLGDCCLARNKCAEAEQLYHQAYEGYCRLYGPTHVRCRTIQGNLAVCYSRQGRYQDAAHALAPVLDESMRTLGPHHHETINQMGNVGIFHRLSGKYVEADELLRQCIQNQTKKVAVYEGMSPAECSVLLLAAFVDPVTLDKQGNVLGFVHLKTKTFLPLSLATAFPQLIQPNHTYELILEKEPPTHHVEPSVADVPATTHPEAVQHRTHHATRETMYNLLVHWDTHHNAGNLPLEKLETLLLGQEHPQLHQAFLAYSSPSSATHRDLDAMVHQVRRVLAVLAQQTKSSFTRVVNQLPLLKPHDIALIHELFTQGTVTAHRSATSPNARNELVLAAWEVYELEEDKDELADTLLRIVRFKRQQASPSLESICREMVERHLLTRAQYQGLLALWEAKNEAMVGAVEAFHVDKDMRELVDTLLLVVKHAGLTGGDGTLSPPPPPHHQSARGFPDSPAHESVVVPQSPEAAPSLEELNPLSPKHSAQRSGTFSSQASQPSAPQSPPSYGTFGTLTSPTASLGKKAGSTTSPPHDKPSDAQSLLDVLLRQSLLTRAQHQLLSHVARDDARLRAAVSAYSASNDLCALAQTLGELYDVLQWETNHDKILQTWIVPLEGQGKGDGLRRLWAGHDPRMMAAYLVFVHDHDEHEFVDTLTRLAALYVQEASTAADQADGQEEAKQIASSLLALHSAGKLSQDVLEALRVDDPRVVAAFDVFESSQDVSELVDTLNRVASTGRADVVHSSDVAASAGAMEKQLLHFVYELDVPAEDVAALKQAIADHDPVVQAAVEVFQVDRDEV
ncbi:hypothetical protein DYB32_004399 [Aphanomyces invadans]|uniref:Uncharacterized protein n=1 Tax=Aphanomyces invadans TaxID=157072 RepID=A0A418AXR4_9STRA|nr:hypothetical protein DYB32_004399 [Aphanomyces invadans]